MSIQLDEYGMPKEYLACEATPQEAEQGKALYHSAAYQERLGRDLYVNGCPIWACPSIVARVGWLDEQRIDAALFAKLLAAVPA